MNHFISKYLLLVWAITAIYGCSPPASKRPRIEIPVVSQKPRKKRKARQISSPSASASAQKLYVVGQRAYYQGEYEEALNNFRRAYKSDPDFIEPQLGLGKVLLDMGQYDKASEIFVGVIVNNDNYFEAYLGLGQTFLYKREYGQALKSLDNALALIPHHPKAEQLKAVAKEKLVEKHLSIGEKKKSLGDLSGGKSEFEKVLKLDPQNVKAHLQLAYILNRRKKYRAAEEHLTKTLSEESANTDALNLLAKILYTSKRLEDSRKTYLRLLELDPTNREARTQLQAVQKAIFTDPGIPLKFYQLSSAGKIRRGDLAAILSMGLKKSTWEESLENIVNVTDTSKHWAKKHIQKTVNTGLMRASSGRDFKPNDPVTRGDLASIIFRIAARIDSSAKSKIKEKFSPYQDIPHTHNLYKPTLYLFINRIMEGEEKHYFGASSQVPGIEALEIVDRLDGYLAKIKNRLLLEAAKEQE